MHQKIYRGYDSSEKLVAILNTIKANKIFLVTGKKSYRLSGANTLIDEVLAGYRYYHFSDFLVNPNNYDIKKGVALFTQEQCDCVIGIGGGSVIDMAKAISLFATQPNKVDVGIVTPKSLKSRTIPIVIIPTTAGTGSESTAFSVAYIDKAKYSIANESMLPDYAILDPKFTRSLTSYISACTGIDALCQCIESLWSVNSTEESRHYSKEGLKLIVANIVTAVNNPEDLSREAMLHASNFSGKAINIAKTTASHSISYPITSFFGVPHGHAVALTLPYFITFNSNINDQNIQDQRGIHFVKEIMAELLSILNVNTPEEGTAYLLAMIKSIRLTSRLSSLGITQKDINIIVDNGFNPERVKNNPRILTSGELYQILEAIR